MDVLLQGMQEQDPESDGDPAQRELYGDQEGNVNSPDLIYPADVGDPYQTGSNVAVWPGGKIWISPCWSPSCHRRGQPTRPAMEAHASPLWSRLPAELHLAVIDLLAPSPASLAALCQTSKSIHALALPALLHVRFSRSALPAFTDIHPARDPAILPRPPRLPR
ncbi:hypothetical protein EWM64_g10598 [Hericium alpestre]|uniref:F-box domain-containing protein n=1 Tax=Hericium alpestre TaxID=135208 RepID=A0A4Y9ZG69_9AGAM|nr:hypothetical protein EWM64_g10598 [Hericium alpestre]